LVFCSHLYHGRLAYSPNESSRRSSFNSDVDVVSVSDAEYHSELSELNMQITKIRQQLLNLEENQGHNDDQYIRVKQDNAILRERVNQLEEQLQTSEQAWKQRLDEAERKNKEMLVRISRERQLEMEASALRYKLLERDHEGCTAEKQRLQSELEALREKFNRISLQLEESLDQLKISDQTLAEKSAECSRLQEEDRARLNEASDTIDELREQLEEISREHDLCNSTTIEDPNNEIAQEVQRLREERKKLLATNDELHAELLQASVDHGKSLLQDGISLADELCVEKMSRDQLMESLKEQETVNQKLRVYVEGILTRVIEMYPAILEIRLDKE
uniref:FIP-RBD domain-containing protein n=1 Tax=Soboliphyme baturini TaxID=241478 RepID=A0A183J3F2_9BILA